MRTLGCLSVITLGGAPGVLSPMGTCRALRKTLRLVKNKTHLSKCKGLIGFIQ